jgi:hypothetical protein
VEPPDVEMGLAPSPKIWDHSAAVGVPSKLREARKAAGLTTRELATARGVSVRAVEQAEMRGARLRDTTYRNYVKAARDALIARADDMSSRLGQAS